MAGGLALTPPAMAARDEVEVDVSQSSSTLQYSITLADMSAGQSIPSNNYRIRGEIKIKDNDDASSAYIQVNTTRLPMRRSSETFYIDLKGSIGGYAPSTTPIRVSFSNKKATIDLIGDLDESSLSIETTNGSYSGTLIITAILL